MCAGRKRRCRQALLRPYSAPRARSGPQRLAALRSRPRRPALRSYGMSLMSIASAPRINTARRPQSETLAAREHPLAKGKGENQRRRTPDGVTRRRPLGNIPRTLRAAPWVTYPTTLRPLLRTVGMAQKIRRPIASSARLRARLFEVPPEFGFSGRVTFTATLRPLLRNAATARTGKATKLEAEQPPVGRRSLSLGWVNPAEVAARASGKLGNNESGGSR